MLPEWTWFLLSFLTIVVTYIISVQKAKNLSRIVLYSILITLVAVIGFIVYVILKTPYNSTYYLNPVHSYGGFGGIALGAYSEVAAVSRINLPIVGTSSIPELVTWIHYIPRRP